MKRLDFVIASPHVADVTFSVLSVIARGIAPKQSHRLYTYAVW